MTSWLPIDSAPKDGTEVLVWACMTIYAKKLSASDADKSCIWVARWDAGCWLSVDDCRLSPTHWMPLPPPPERQA